MSTVVLGKCYEAFKGLPDGVSLVEHGGYFLMTLSFNDISDEITDIIKNGEITLNYGNIDDVCMMTISFGNIIIVDCVVANPIGIKPITFEPGFGYPVTLVLVDPANGEVKSLQSFGLSTYMSTRIHSDLVKQGMVNPNELMSKVSEIQKKYDAMGILDAMTNRVHFSIK